MVITRLIAIIIGLFVVAATLLPSIRKEHWWIRVFDFPRMQIVALGFISLIFFLINWKDHWAYFGLFTSVVLAIAFQFKMIFPYTPFAKKQVITCKDPGSNPVFSLMVMNVYMYNQQFEKALEIINRTNPDILIAVEINHCWNEKLSSLCNDYPYHVQVPLENTYGIVLYSKLKLINPKVKYIYIKDVPSIRTRVQLKNGQTFKLYAVHPKPPAPGHSETSTHRDAELISVGKETRKDDQPVIVAGDLNDVAWSYTTNLFRKFSELLDPRRGRGMFNTFHARYWLMRWPLDHVFHSDDFQLLEIKTLSYFGSDHFPIYVKLCYLPHLDHQQEEPTADEDDVERAKDKMDRAEDEEPS